MSSETLEVIETLIVEIAKAPETKTSSEMVTGADVKIMDRFFRHRKVPLPRKIFKTRISA